MIGFSPYVRAHAVLGWESGLTIIWCYECRAFSAVVDDRPSRTYRCSRLAMHDLLNQSEHLAALKSDEDNDTDSA